MQEENRAVLIDADFLSSFLKIGRLALIKDFFRVENLYIPVAVFSELAKTTLIPAFLLACKKSEFLDSKEILQIMKDLKNKDYYEFSEDEKKRLL